ncbi:MAG: TonB family protein [Desulfovibrio sp.]|nr:TonB family protein [Desulfovibrio sp.]
MPVGLPIPPALLRLGASLILTLLLCPDGTGHAAAIVSSGLDADYTNKVTSAVIRTWAPPPSLKNDFEVRVKITIDENGKVEFCKVLSSSGLEAFDDAACGAIKKTGPFGTPPYAQPLNIYMTFWSGSPKGKAQPMPLDTEAAMRTEIMAQTKAEATRKDQQASSMEKNARQRAEAAAKASGKELPTVRTAPIAPSAPAKRNTEKPRPPAPTFATQNAKSSPATQRIASAESSSSANASTTIRKAATPTIMESKSASVPPANVARPTNSTLQPQKSSDVPSATTTAYRRDVESRLKKTVVIPAETQPGTYTALLRLQIAPDGTVKKLTTLSSSGDVYLDKAIRSGIRRMGKLSAPPEAINGILDITLTMTRR